MPIYNITVDDISPMFVYSSGWHDSSTQDPDHAQYLNDTFHATNTTGSSVSFNFNGSAVWLNGAKRSNHGHYTITLDGNNQTFNGFAEDPGVFQTPIFSKTQLETEPHSLLLEDHSSNPLNNWVDVDFLTFTAGDGDSSTVLFDSSVDDGAPAISYSSGWSTVPNSLISSYFNQTFHVTNQTGAQARITFNGSAIALYGATSSNHGSFEVSLDGGKPLQMDGHAPTFRPQTLLYYASGLANTTHTVDLVNTDTNNAFLDLDRAVVSQYFHAGAEPPSSSSLPATLEKHHGPNKGAIAGGVIAALLGLLAIGLAPFIIRRMRQHRVRKPSQPATMYGFASPGASIAGGADNLAPPHSRARTAAPPRNASPALEAWQRGVSVAATVSEVRAAPEEVRSAPSEYLAGTDIDNISDYRPRSVVNAPLMVVVNSSSRGATAGSSVPPAQRHWQLHVANPEETRLGHP